MKALMLYSIHYGKFDFVPMIFPCSSVQTYGEAFSELKGKLGAKGVIEFLTDYSLKDLDRVGTCVSSTLEFVEIRRDEDYDDNIIYVFRDDVGDLRTWYLRLGFVDIVE
jgi:hypothetical protein